MLFFVFTEHVDNNTLQRLTVITYRKIITTSAEVA